MLEGLRQPLDKWMSPVTRQILESTFKQSVATLAKAEPNAFADNPNAKAYLAGNFKIGAAPPSADQVVYGPTRTLNAAEKKQYDLGKEVFHRDAHCATCHQSNGAGVAGIYPPLNVANNPWLAEDERLIKVVLKGLWGPLELGGQRFGPKNGVPPMLGLGGMITDEEAAPLPAAVTSSRHTTSSGRAMPRAMNATSRPKASTAPSPPAIIRTNWVRTSARCCLV